MDLIALLLAAILACFGINFYNNKKARDEYADLLKAVDEQNREKEHNREVMEFEQNERLAAKQRLETELNREVTDEEIVNYLNDRYKHS